MVRAFENPTGETIRIVAPWGEEQVGGPDCMIVSAYDPEKPSVLSEDRYIVGRQEFEETYGAPVELPAERVREPHPLTNNASIEIDDGLSVSL